MVQVRECGPLCGQVCWHLTLTIFHVLRHRSATLRVSSVLVRHVVLRTVYRCSQSLFALRRLNPTKCPRLECSPLLLNGSGITGCTPWLVGGVRSTVDRLRLLPGSLAGAGTRIRFVLPLPGGAEASKAMLARALAALLADGVPCPRTPDEPCDGPGSNCDSHVHRSAPRVLIRYKHCRIPCI